MLTPELFGKPFDTVAEALIASAAITAVPVMLVDPDKPRRIVARVQGMGPLMVDPIPPETVLSMITGVKQPVNKDRPLQDICKDKLKHLRTIGIDDAKPNPEGRIALRRGQLMGCLNTAGRTVKYRDKSNIATAETSFLPSFFKIEHRWLVLFDSNGNEPGWDVNTDVGNGMTTKNAIVRPRIEEWNFDMIFQYDTNAPVSEQMVRKLFTMAGKEIGLGCFRVSRKGECGQFKIAQWRDITPKDWKDTGTQEPNVKVASKKPNRLATAAKEMGLDTGNSDESNLVGAGNSGNGQAH